MLPSNRGPRAHLRGYFESPKNGGALYYGSSYELRCFYLLEADPTVVGFRRCEAFLADGGWRNPDLWVDFVDGTSQIWEIKPESRLDAPEVVHQLADSQAHAAQQGVAFRVWTEADSGLKDGRAIIAWAQAYRAERRVGERQTEQRRLGRKQIRARYYARRVAADTVDVWCDYCSVTHSPLRLTYKKNIARNGTYVCERYGGHLAGSRPKPHLQKVNPHAAEGKKLCTGCGELRVIDAFDVRRRSWDGRAARCKACLSRVNAESYARKKAAQRMEAG